MFVITTQIYTVYTTRFELSSEFVLVCSDWCYRLPWTGWLINNKNLFLTVLEAGRSSVKVQEIQHLEGEQFLVHRQPCLACVLTWLKDEGVLQGLFYKGAHAFYESSAFMT